MCAPQTNVQCVLTFLFFLYLLHLLTYKFAEVFFNTFNTCEHLIPNELTILLQFKTFHQNSGQNTNISRENLINALENYEHIG
jgi:hypothetical protein